MTQLQLDNKLGLAGLRRAPHDDIGPALPLLKNFIRHLRNLFCEGWFYNPLERKLRECAFLEEIER